MSGSREGLPVSLAFEEASLRIPIADILPLRQITPAILRSVKYAQIAASIEEVGIIEPPVVARDRKDREKFLLLDGHVRIDILARRGETQALRARNGGGDVIVRNRSAEPVDRLGSRRREPRMDRSRPRFRGTRRRHDTGSVAPPQAGNPRSRRHSMPMPLSGEPRRASASSTWCNPGASRRRRRRPSSGRTAASRQSISGRTASIQRLPPAVSATTISSGRLTDHPGRTRPVA